MFLFYFTTNDNSSSDWYWLCYEYDPERVYEGIERFINWVEKAEP